MKIIQLDIDGYRSLKNISWKPGDLNVIIGPNGSGKSNLLRFLELIAVSSQGRLGKFVQTFGGMDALLWDGKAEKIEWTLRTSPIEQGRSMQRDSMTYRAEMARLGAGSFYRIQHELLANYYRVESRQSDQPFKFLERFGPTAKIFDENEHGLVAPEESVPDEETLLSIASGPFLANQYITRFQQNLSSWSIYHDVHVNKDALIRQPVVTRSERTVDSDGQNLIAVLHTLYSEDRDFKKDVNYAMRTAFGEDFDELVFPPAADQKVQLRVRWKSLKREQSAADLSDGTLRFLFLLTVLASPSPARLIAIDEPEVGLHPSMLPIVAEYAVDAAIRTQVILTTHSPQFLDSFRDASMTTTVTKWKDGETVLRTLSGDELEYWLKEYSLGSLQQSGELEEMG